MSLYTRLNATAERLVTTYGRELTFTKTAIGAFDPATGVSAETTSTYKAYAVKDDYSSFERNDSSIQIDDIKLVCGVAAFAVDDTVSIESQDYKVVRVNPIKPGPTLVAYELQVRK